MSECVGKRAAPWIEATEEKGQMDIKKDRLFKLVARNNNTLTFVSTRMAGYGYWGSLFDTTHPAVKKCCLRSSVFCFHLSLANRCAMYNRITPHVLCLVFFCLKSEVESE